MLGPNPTTTRLGNAIFDEVQMLRRVRVGVDRQRDAQIRGPAGVDLVQVEPARIGVAPVAPWARLRRRGDVV